MKHDDLEKDPLWDLLRENPGHRPGPRFVDDVVRAARLTPTARPWWCQIWLPVSASGVLAGATALALVLISQRPASVTPSSVRDQAVATVTPPADSFAEMQDGVETEVLMAATDHLNSYSDDELVSLIGF